MAPSAAGATGPQAVDHRSADRRLHLQGDALVAAPGRRHGQSAALSERIDEAGQRPVRHAVAFPVVDDGGDHQPAAGGRERAQHRVREAGAGTLAHHDDQRDLVGGGQRSVAAAHVDGLEPAARLEPLPYRPLQVRAGRIAQVDARECDDLGVGQREVAVDPNLGNGFGGDERPARRWFGSWRAGRVGRLGERGSERQRHDLQDQRRRRRAGNDPPPWRGRPMRHDHRSASNGRRRPPVSASR